MWCAVTIHVVQCCRQAKALHRSPQPAVGDPHFLFHARFPADVKPSPAGKGEPEGELLEWDVASLVCQEYIRCATPVSKGRGLRGTCRIVAPTEPMCKKEMACVGVRGAGW